MPRPFPFLQMSLRMIWILHPLQVRKFRLLREYHHNIYDRCPDLADFNNTNVTIIFEPDENAAVNEKSAPIFVTDDAINEATEQVFVVELRVISSVDPVAVDLTVRPSALCGIIDNDRMCEYSGILYYRHP